MKLTIIIYPMTERIPPAAEVGPLIRAVEVASR